MLDALRLLPETVSLLAKRRALSSPLAGPFRRTVRSIATPKLPPHADVLEIPTSVSKASLKGASARAGTAASSQKQSGRRAAHFTAKAMPASPGSISRPWQRCGSTGWSAFWAGCNVTYALGAIVRSRFGGWRSPSPRAVGGRWGSRRSSHTPRSRRPALGSLVVIHPFHPPFAASGWRCCSSAVSARVASTCEGGPLGSVSLPEDATIVAGSRLSGR
jgi:hypothetical protein